MMNETAETKDAIREMIDSAARVEGYAYASGALSVMLEDAIALLPKAKRADFRERLYRFALELERK